METSNSNPLLQRRTLGIAGLVVVAAIVLVACSGGGGSDTPQPAMGTPTPSNSPAPSSPSATTETINGIAVPPEPDPAVNNATIQGVDSNSNGVRDDVERLIAKNFGSNAPMYAVATKNAKTLQAALLNPTPAAVKEHIDAFRCIRDIKQLEDLDTIDMEILNTPVRKATYGRAFAGSFNSREGC